jgi:tRNA isopentenyl-2-thiomethyl-A-37 hydroxylase MiaE
MFMGSASIILRDSTAEQNTKTSATEQLDITAHITARATEHFANVADVVDDKAFADNGTFNAKRCVFECAVVGISG